VYGLELGCSVRRAGAEAYCAAFPHSLFDNALDMELTPNFMKLQTIVVLFLLLLYSCVTVIYVIYTVTLSPSVHTRTHTMTNSSQCRHPSEFNVVHSLVQTLGRGYLGETSSDRCKNVFYVFNFNNKCVVTVFFYFCIFL